MSIRTQKKNGFLQQEEIKKKYKNIYCNTAI